jgi:hypothetical protein
MISTLGTRTISWAVNLLYVAVLCIFLSGSYQLIAGLLAQKELFVSISNGHLAFSDFVLFYLAGKMTLSPDAHNVYDPQTQLAWFNQLLAPWHLDKPFYFQDMPFVFPLMTPLAHLPMQNAFFVWLAVCIPFGLAALYLILSRETKLSRLQKLAVLLGVLASFPALTNIRMGQQAWFLLAFECLYFCALFAKRDIAAGVALACTSFKPHYSLFFLIPALALKRWKLIASAAIFELGLCILAGITIGWQNVFSYPQILMHAESTKDFLGVASSKMISIRGITSLLLPQEIAVPLCFLVMILALVGSYFLWQKLIAQKQDLKFATCLTVLLCLVASPHSHAYDLPLLAILAITLPTTDIMAANKLKLNYLRAWCLLLISYPLISWCLPMLASINLSLPFALFFVLNLTLLALGLTIQCKNACLKLSDAEAINN